MPETKQSESLPKQPKKEKPSAPKKVELRTAYYPYPCALCGKSNVAWKITGDAFLNPANQDFVMLPLKHEVCGQEITLDVKLEELK